MMGKVEPPMQELAETIPNARDLLVVTAQSVNRLNKEDSHQCPVTATAVENMIPPHSPCS